MQSTEQCLASSKLWTPYPLSTQRVSVLPPHQRRGGGGGTHADTRLAVRGWGINILEDARHWIGLLQYNLSSHLSIE
jgi:hypothetical protein